MNGDFTLTTHTAVFLALLAAFFWGSWMVILKVTSGVPQEIFYLIMFVATFFFIWGVGFVLDGDLLFSNIREVFSSFPLLVLSSLFLGAVYVWTTLMSVKAMQAVGFSLYQPIMSSVNLIFGTLVSYLVGGRPENMQNWRLVVSGVLLIAAIIFTSIAGEIRSRKKSDGLKLEKNTKKNMGLMTLGAFSGVVYSLAISFGMKTVSQPNGLNVMPFLCVVLTGSCLGALLLCGIPLTVQKRWHEFKLVSLKSYVLFSLAACVHYSGHVMHAFATCNLSSVLSWPLSMTSGLWIQLWGCVFGEFRHAPFKAHVLLGLGIISYIAGAYTLANF